MLTENSIWKTDRVWWVFFCNSWVNLKPPSPTPPPTPPFWEKRSRNDFLWLSVPLESCPSQGSSPVGAKPHGHTGTDFTLEFDTSVQLQMWERKSRHRRQIKRVKRKACHSLQLSRGEDERLYVHFRSLLFLFQVSACPSRSRGARMLWLLTLMFILNRHVSGAAWAAYGKGHESQENN